MTELNELIERLYSETIERGELPKPSIETPSISVKHEEEADTQRMLHVLNEMGALLNEDDQPKIEESPSEEALLRVLNHWEAMTHSVQGIKEHMQSLEQDIVKIAVVERHRGTGNVGLGLLEGYGLRGGAIATSVAHDSHNIIVAGDDDRDMALAVERLIEIGGGLVIVQNGEVLGSLMHEIAGLMTDRPGDYVARCIDKLCKLAWYQLGVHENIDPFMALCFMALPVIPNLKLTDTGLFDVNAFRTVPVEI